MPRSKPRDLASVQNYMNHVRPILLDFSARYDHLREVTRDDILAVLNSLHGSRRCNVLVGLRRLFAFCRKTRVVFRDPTRGIKVGQRPYGIAQPLDQAMSTRPSRPPRPPSPASSSSWPLSTPPARPPSSLRSSTTSTWATGGSPSPDGPARSTSSPTRSCSNGSTIGAPAGPTPPTRI
jgi:hypothetical protein